MPFIPMPFVSDIDMLVSEVDAFVSDMVFVLDMEVSWVKPEMAMSAAAQILTVNFVSLFIWFLEVLVG
jgi:hypothetical protein